MRAALVTAGAAGMYCGSCLHDNTLVAALLRQGHDALLIPCYTPIRTDEADVSHPSVFLGGINVYLQQKFALFRHTPRLLDRLLDGRRLLNWVSRFAMTTQAERLAELTISVLQGNDGRQRKEVARLADWLAAEVKPELIVLTNVLLSGIVPELKRRLGVPVLAELQGDDIYLESLPPGPRARCIELIRRQCEHVDGYLVTCRYYADFMAVYLGLPRDRMHVVYPGLNLKGHGGPRLPAAEGAPPAVGYFARVAPEKGLHNLVDAFIMLRQSPGAPPARLRVSGWLGAHNRPYFDGLRQRLAAAGLADSFEHVESPTLADKVRFLRSVDVLSVPTTYREPKGLYVLEALANGVPVVQPRHGSFPELIEATGGGLLVEPDNPADLAAGLRRLLDDPALRRELGAKGQEAVRGRFSDDEMAARTLEVFRRYVPAA
jgi:glycosyltransferase involved in cell wall biosynthesis